MLTTLVPTAPRLCTRWLAMVACFGPRRRCHPAQTFAVKKPPGLSGAHCHGGMIVTSRALLGPSRQAPAQTDGERSAAGRGRTVDGAREHAGRTCRGADAANAFQVAAGMILFVSFCFPGAAAIVSLGGLFADAATLTSASCRTLRSWSSPNQVPCITSPVFALLAGQQVACGAPIASKEQEHWPLGSGGIRAGPGLFARDCCRSRGAQVLGRSGASGPYQLAAPGRSFQLLRSEPQRRRSTARAIGPSGAWLLGVAVCDRQPTTPVTPRLGAEIGSWWGCRYRPIKVSRSAP